MRSSNQTTDIDIDQRTRDFVYWHFVKKGHIFFETHQTKLHKSSSFLNANKS